MDLLSFFPAWLLEHGVAFAIVLPLLTGAITAVLSNRTLAWWTAFIVTLLVTFTSFGLVLQMMSEGTLVYSCLLYTSPSPRDLSTSRMPSSA